MKSIVRRARRIYRRTRFGFPAGAISRAEYVGTDSTRWTPAHDANEPVRRPPRRFGKRTVDWDGDLLAFPQMGVTHVPDGRIDGRNGWVFTPDNRVLMDDTWYGAAFDAATLTPSPFPRPHRLRGTCLNLTSDWTHVNYGHFLLDGLSRFAIFERSGLRLDAVDHVYLNKPTSDSNRRLIEALGIPLAKCVFAEDSPMVRADVLLSPSFPGTRRNYPDWVPSFLRRAVSDATPRGRRLYIPRSTNRLIANEPEIVGILKARGFEVYDHRQVPYEPDFFAGAEIIVGAHGAGLTNMAFRTPGMQVLELVPSDHVHPYYYTLADAAGHNYSYLIGKSEVERPKGAVGPSYANFSIDAADFGAALDIVILDACPP